MTNISKDLKGDSCLFKGTCQKLPQQVGENVSGWAEHISDSN